ncbi:MAG: lysylphosphatidylglycerol synthase transmembrane domain-containing protein [Bacteroidota bacterium]
MKKILFNILKFSLFLSIGIFFIWLSVRKLSSDDIQHILDTRHNVNYFWISAAVISGILSHIFRTLRWIQLLETLGKKPRFINTLGAVFIGYFANLAIPRLGEASRCGVLTKFEDIPFNKSFGTVITERLIDMLCFVIVFFLTLLFEFKLLYNLFNQYVLIPIAEKFNAGGTLTLVLLLGLLLLLGLIAFVLVKKYLRNLYDKLFDFIKGLTEGLKSLFVIKRPFLFLSYTFGIWFMYFLMAYFSLICLPETRHLGLTAGLAVLAFGSIGIMVSAGGIGAYPYFTKITLLLFLIPENIGLAVGWVSWSLQTIILIIFGIIALIVLPMINNTNKV